MGKDSKIEWTDHTFNPWIGCSKVSPGCANCYAETLNHRMGWVTWGDRGTRRRTSEQNWKNPITWNKQAAKAGKRFRVFCASMADWLDQKAPTEWRLDLLELIASTPNLDWLLLTKRPEFWRFRMLECIWSGSRFAQDWIDGKVPSNVWLGTSVEDQTRAEERIPNLIEIPARVKFLSVEPMLGPIDLSYWISESIVPQLQWVIVGGESGHGARPMEKEWVQTIRDECVSSGVAFFFKQWGGRLKSMTGRELDGMTWSEFPEVKS